MIVKNHECDEQFELRLSQTCAMKVLELLRSVKEDADTDPLFVALDEALGYTSKYNFLDADGRHLAESCTFEHAAAN